MLFRKIIYNCYLRLISRQRRETIFIIFIININDSVLLDGGPLLHAAPHVLRRAHHALQHLHQQSYWDSWRIFFKGGPRYTIQDLNQNETVIVKISTSHRISLTSEDRNPVINGMDSLDQYLSSHFYQFFSFGISLQKILRNIVLFLIADFRSTNYVTWKISPELLIMVE